jgi:hypothetical protein
MQIDETIEEIPASSPRISNTPYSLLEWVIIYVES